MSWTINDEELPRQDFDEVISSEKLDEQAQVTRETDTGKLYLIDRSENNRKLRKFLSPREIDAHKKLVAFIGVGVIAPFTSIETLLLPSLGKFQIRAVLTRLWVEGYLEKYAKGIYGASRSNWKGKKNSWRGKYFGVHYEIKAKRYL